MKDRFTARYFGGRWCVNDRQTDELTPHPNEKAAKEAAEYNQYCWEQTIEGNERFNREEFSETIRGNESWSYWNGFED